MNDYRDIVQNWGVKLNQPRDDLNIAGSPERSVSRTVFEDLAGRSYILEQISPKNMQRKREIARKLSLLHQHGLTTATPYLSTNDDFILSHQDTHWMLRPYVNGAELNRTTYGSDAWRGDALAEALLAMNVITRRQSELQAGLVFSLPQYIGHVLPKLEALHPGITKRTQVAIRFLEEHLFPIYQELPTAFCHGDFHPLNVIWGKGTINALIDWEFCGIKPELYDVALLLGCIGFDEPDNLTGPLAKQFLRGLTHKPIFHSRSWTSLVPLMVAIRIAWLREWVIRNEREGLEQELAYLQILIAFFHEKLLEP